MTDRRRLVRNTRDKMLGGVCAGIADYLETDPTVIRVVWLVVSLFTGFFPGVILYFVFWVIMPEGEPAPPDGFD